MNGGLSKRKRKKHGLWTLVETPPPPPLHVDLIYQNVVFLPPKPPFF